MRWKVLIPTMLVLVILVTSTVPSGEQRPARHIRFDTAPPKEVPGKDSDLDGIADRSERVLGLDPYDPDSDDDGLPDGIELDYWNTRVQRAKDGEMGAGGLSFWLKEGHGYDEGLNRTRPTGDADDDGLVNILDPDSDDDGSKDGSETMVKTDPADPDSDKDGVPDGKDRRPLIDSDDNGNGIPDDLEAYEKETSHDHTEGTMDIGEGIDIDHINDVVFYVEPVERPRYWRMRAYDTFDGTLWSMSDPDLTIYGGGVLATGVLATPASEDDYRITFDQKAMGYLPTALNTRRLHSLDPEVDVEVDSFGNFHTTGLSVHAYNFTTVTFNFSQEELLTAGLDDDPDMNRYLQLPPTISDRVVALAAELGAAADTPFGKATHIADYLRENHKFNLNVQVPSASDTADPVDWFLFEAREGKSVEFTTAFVVLLRLNGIHSRPAEGFAIGEVEDGKRVVRKGHGHAWGEVHLAGLGWLIMESTGHRVVNEGSTGVKASGADTSVYSGDGPGTGGGTTTPDPDEGTTNLTERGDITFTVDKKEVWKGEVFTVTGTVMGDPMPEWMDVTVRLSHDEGRTATAGKGGVRNGTFRLICTPEEANAGVNQVLVTAVGMVAGVQLTASYTGEPPELTIKSNTTIEALAPDAIPSGEVMNVRVTLTDVGGIHYFDRSIDLRWANRSWEVWTISSETELLIPVQEENGTYELILVFPGDDHLAPSAWKKVMEVRDDRLMLELTIMDAGPFTVGDVFEVAVSLKSMNGTSFDATVAIRIGDVRVGDGETNGPLIAVYLSPQRFEAGSHRVWADFEGGGGYPNASVFEEVDIIGTTRVLMGPKRVSIGEAFPLRPILVDNLNNPLPRMRMTASWTSPSGSELLVDGLTDDSGEFEVLMDTRGESPGVFNMSLRFAGTYYYEPSTSEVPVTLSSPTVLMADFPPTAIRGEGMEVTGHIFNYKGDGMPATTLRLHLNGSEIGTTTTFGDGSFLFMLDLLMSVPLGETTMKVRFDGTDLLDPSANSTTVTIQGRPKMTVDGPERMDTGQVYTFTVTLKDDRDEPMAGRDVVFVVRDGGSYRRTVVTDDEGRAKLAVKAGGEEMTVRADFGGEGYMLPSYALKVVAVSAWNLITMVVIVILAVVSSLAIFSFVSSRYFLSTAKGAVIRLNRIRIKDKHRREIYRTYREASHLLGEKGVPRKVSETVREYERSVADGLDVDARAVAVVTEVFEEARYSDHRMRKRHTKRIRKGLKRLTDSLQEPER